MKQISIKQNSEEWLEFRKGKSGGSELGKLWSPRNNDITNPKKHYYEMLAERVARPMTPNDYADKLNGESFSLMARGHILEPEAAEAFSKAYNIALDDFDGVWVSDTNPDIYISPDRQITSPDGIVHEAVEIKCPDSPTVLEIWKTQAIPKEYIPQVCQYFIVNKDLETLYFVVYTDLIPGLELQVFKVSREMAENMGLEAKEEFEKALMAELDNDIKKLDKLSNF